MKNLNKNLIGGMIAVALILSLFALNVFASDGSDGMVCGTLSDLEKMFASNAAGAEDLPPADYIISKADYNILVSDGIAEASSAYNIEVLKDGWVKIKLISGSCISLKSILIDGADASSLMEKDVNYLILNNKKGKHKLEINFLVKINEGNFGDDSRDMKLGDIPEAPISILKIEIPKRDIGIEITPSFDTKINEYGNKTIATATLVSSGGVSVVWHPKREGIIKEKLPAKVYADVNSLISVGEGVMKCYSIIDYSITQNSINKFRIRIPSDINVLEVSDFNGNPINEYKIEDNTLLIQTPYEASKSYRIILRYEKDMGGTSAVSNVPEIKLLDVERENGYIGVEARTNVEINTAESSGVTRIDVNELPQEIWMQSKNPLLFGYKYLKHPYSVTLDIKKHEDLTVLVAAIDYAKIMTLLTEDGKSITKATYYVKNNRKQFLEVALPKNSEIWSTFVSDAPVKPSKNEDGKILIPLSRSAGYEGSLYAFSVEFVYITNISGFGIFGSNTYEIPSVDIPISQLNLLLYSPKDYDLIKFEGDMKKAEYFEGYDTYGAQNYGQETKNAQGLPLPPPVMTQSGGASNVDYSQNEAIAFQNEIIAATEKGVLPVKVNIPENGKLYTLTKLLVTEDKKLIISAEYINSEIYTWIGRIILLSILVLGFYVVRSLKNLRKQKTKILLIIIIPSIITCFLSDLWNYAIFGWSIVFIAAVIYGLYIVIKRYAEKNTKAIENKTSGNKNEA